MYQFIYKNQKIIALSDTHGRHREISIPTCDILIHLGDACNNGDEAQLTDFFAWFKHQQAKYKLFVAGNHDLPFDLNPEDAQLMIPSEVIYMSNSSLIIEDIAFVSVEARPWMHQPVECKSRADIFLSHGIPDGIGLSDGCSILMQTIITSKAKIALFGHVHLSAQPIVVHNDIQFVNVNQ